MTLSSNICTNDQENRSLSMGKMAFIKFKKNKLAIVGAVVLTLLVLFAVFAPLLSSYKIDDIDLYNISVEPSAEHILGTDEIGRDVFTRLIYGGRVSLGVGIFATLIQVFIGTVLGALAGYYGGIVDSVIMRIVDVIMCFPFFMIAVTIAAVIGPSVWNLIIIIAMLSWTSIARIVRAEVLALKEREFIEASRALGMNNYEVILKHILPNILSPILVSATLSIANSILTESALSFLGMGVRPPQPSWGNMLTAAQSMNTLKYEWWLWIPPGLMIFLTVLSINFLGDGLRDALDPKEKV
ncbi:ABC transporter permease [Oceanirhabdus seepicola]|uniref:ABC transporter permease n=1 Tax=Oceanirhabdus seepicola TaxID=2828781 RepID=A0A9J6NWY0_9CLOT|nr:oligopeptide ABC transporter permease [Oceanirhabdus seepicola]MCM1988962.1 ABC transporter permease [Oceanirhabdus seepicola]